MNQPMPRRCSPSPPSGERRGVRGCPIALVVFLLFAFGLLPQESASAASFEEIIRTNRPGWIAATQGQVPFRGIG